MEASKLGSSFVQTNRTEEEEERVGWLAGKDAGMA